MEKNNDFQEKFYLYQTLINQRELLNEQLELIDQSVEDTLITENAVEELGKQEGKDILATVGKDTFLFAEIKEKNKLLVELGAGVLAKKSLEEARKILESRRKELEENRKEIAIRLERISLEILKIEPEIKKVLEKD